MLWCGTRTHFSKKKINHIWNSIEFNFWWADRNKVLHMSRQDSCRAICKNVKITLLVLLVFGREQNEVFMKFEFDRNIISKMVPESKLSTATALSYSVSHHYLSFLSALVLGLGCLMSSSQNIWNYLSIPLLQNWFRPPLNLGMAE